MLHINAYMLGIAAVLSIEQEGIEFSVSYFSKKLTSAERSYNASEMEYLAVSGKGCGSLHHPPTTTKIYSDD